MAKPTGVWSKPTLYSSLIFLAQLVALIGVYRHVATASELGLDFISAGVGAAAARQSLARKPNLLNVLTAILALIGIAGLVVVLCGNPHFGYRMLLPLAWLALQYQLSPVPEGPPAITETSETEGRTPTKTGTPTEDSVRLNS